LIAREANSEDVENLGRLVTELGYPSSTEDTGRHSVETSADTSYGTLVAERGGQILGITRPRDTASTKSSSQSLYCTAIPFFASSALSSRRLRAMIWRFTSLVPSPISLILTCRQ
jgi:hypothetical protein